MATSTMRAQVLEEYNKPYVLKTVSLPEISTENDLLIKIDAAG